MADLIDRQALIKNAGRLPFVVKSTDHPYDAVRTQGQTFKKLVQTAPAVDAVEVVRCRDCKYSMLWRKPTTKAVGECWFRKMYSEDEQFALVDADDFCSYGKRREENGAD